MYTCDTIAVNNVMWEGIENSHLTTDVRGRPPDTCWLHVQWLRNYQERFLKTSMYTTITLIAEENLPACQPLPSLLTHSHVLLFLPLVLLLLTSLKIQQCLHDASKGRYLPSDYQFTANTGGKYLHSTSWAYPLTGVLEFLVPYSLPSSSQTSVPETPSEDDEEMPPQPL